MGRDSVQHPFGESVVLHRFKEYSGNAHGQTTKVFHPDETIEGAAVAPYGPAEPADGLSERATYELRVFVGPGLGIGPEDEMTVRGQIGRASCRERECMSVSTGSARRTR